jgi:hypothetical protein
VARSDRELRHIAEIVLADRMRRYVTTHWRTGAALTDCAISLKRAEYLPEISRPHNIWCSETSY